MTPMFNLIKETMKGREAKWGKQGVARPMPSGAPTRQTTLLTFVFLIFVIISKSAQAGPSYDTPEATIQTYIDALRRGDQPGVAVCLEPEDHGFYLPGPMPIDRFKIRKRTIYGPADERNWKGFGYTERMVRGDVGLEIEEIINGNKHIFYYRLRRVKGQWKIVVIASDTR